MPGFNNNGRPVSTSWTLGGWSTTRISFSSICARVTTRSKCCSAYLQPVMF